MDGFSIGKYQFYNEDLKTFVALFQKPEQEFINDPHSLPKSLEETKKDQSNLALKSNVCAKMN